MSSLKDYLARHGISSTGKKSKLVELAFSVNAMKRPEQKCMLMISNNHFVYSITEDT